MGSSGRNSFGEMSKFIFGLLAILIYIVAEDQIPSSSCCERKKVGEFSYTLVSAGDDSQLPERCKNSCVYSRDGAQDKTLYCFATGDLSSTCLGGGSCQNAITQTSLDELEDKLLNAEFSTRTNIVIESFTKERFLALTNEDKIGFVLRLGNFLLKMEVLGKLCN